MTQITPHFSDTETGWASIPVALRGNARATLDLAERIRTAGGGVPLRVTSLYRSFNANLAAQGAKRSCHLDARGIDFVPLTKDKDGWARKVFAAIQSGAFHVGEGYYYPFDGHMHVTLPGCGGNNELLVKPGAESPFIALAAWLGTTKNTAILVLLVTAGLFATVKG